LLNGGCLHIVTGGAIHLRRIVPCRSCS
jgi:hypothetical protein